MDIGWYYNQLCVHIISSIHTIFIYHFRPPHKKEDIQVLVQISSFWARQKVHTKCLKQNLPEIAIEYEFLSATNFEAFCCNFSSSTKPEIGKSELCVYLRVRQIQIIPGAASFEQQQHCDDKQIGFIVSLHSFCLRSQLFALLVHPLPPVI